MFAQNLSEYPDLKALEEEFKMFYDLTTTAFDATGSIQDWKENSFIKLNANEIEKSVSEWL
ncbi:hypothetical protein COB52_05375 [Candidatus Kaiserbacteria bacterium]|nr:MAG: hypothetical protein COB52_05375 [Candidatus Kaiserbacteria bacterium]